MKIKFSAIVALFLSCMSFSEGSDLKLSLSSGVIDPQVSARTGFKGDMYCNTDATSGGNCYIKQDGGRSTNWKKIKVGSETVYKRVATAVSYSALSTDTVIGVTSNASPRTITLPLASSVLAGQLLIIKDEACTAASANNITVTRSGSDLIDNLTSVSITVNCGAIKLYSNGSNAWESI